jgi:hypothetical protein
LLLPLLRVVPAAATTPELRIVLLSPFIKKTDAKKRLAPIRSLTRFTMSTLQEIVLSDEQHIAAVNASIRKDFRNLLFLRQPPNLWHTMIDFNAPTGGFVA